MSEQYSLFCQYADDVRQETTGKSILIGLYQGDMNVSGPLPVTLPQLVVIAHFIVGADAPPISQFKVSIHQGSKLLFEGEPPQPAFSQEGASAQAGDPKILQLTFVLGAFAVEREERLSVSAVINGKHTLKGNPLHIRHQSTNSST